MAAGDDSPRWTPDTIDVDLAFLAMPTGASAGPAVTLAERGIAVVDLGGDLRFTSPQRHVDAHGQPPPHPAQMGRWEYGLPELFGDRIRHARRVAVAGCYPTAATLALAPLLGDGLIRPRVVVDAKSGITGAGRSLRPDLMFAAVDGSVTAYAVGKHRHRPEIEQALEAVAGVTPSVTFTAHLVPMTRGLLATCYAEAVDGVTRQDLVDSLAKRYAAAPFVDRRRRPAAHQVGGRLESLPHLGGSRRPHRFRGGGVGDRQPAEGSGRSGGPVRQPDVRPRRGRRAPDVGGDAMSLGHGAPSPVKQRIAMTMAKARIFSEAVPFIREYRGRTVVVKYGGAAMVDEALRASFADDVAMLHFSGHQTRDRPRRRPGHLGGDAPAGRRT